MKKELPQIVEEGRVKTGPYGSDSSYGNNGAFNIKLNGVRYSLIISDQKGWDHVSVSKPTMRVPNWKEMCRIKELLFEGDEVVVQYHPKKKDYINMHPGVLHLWRCQDKEFPTPPKEFV